MYNIVYLKLTLYTWSDETFAFLIIFRFVCVCERASECRLVSEVGISSLLFIGDRLTYIKIKRMLHVERILLQPTARGRHGIPPTARLPSTLLSPLVVRTLRSAPLAILRSLRHPLTLIKRPNSDMIYLGRRLPVTVVGSALHKRNIACAFSFHCPPRTPRGANRLRWRQRRARLAAAPGVKLTRLLRRSS